MKSHKKAPSLDEYVAEKDTVRFAENQELARAARAARAVAAEQQAELAALKRRVGLYEKLDAARLEPPTWLAPKMPSKGHAAIPCLVVTDWHWGEVVKPEQVDGVNKYNVTIAEARMKRAFEGAVTITRDYLKGVNYEGFQLFLGGDMISGDIHPELRETNEQTVAESIVALVEPLEAGVNLLAREFGRIHITAVPGNHPRNTKKPISKKRAADNFDTLAYRLLERDMRGRKDVTVQVSEAADAQVTVYGTRYLLTHGDQFTGGSGISGALAPLLLGAHRKTRRQAAAGHPYDLLVMGHFHQSIFFPAKGIIVSGCGIGYNEWAYVSNFEPEPPQCAMWLTTAERGVTVSAPVFVADPVAEGWALG